MKTAATLYVYRGIPGIGKTTFIRQRHRDAIVHSADYWFEKADGSYVFNAKELGNAHGNCFRQAVEQAQRNTLLRHIELDIPRDIVIDNTSISVAEVAPYASIAQAYDHDLRIVTLVCPSEDVMKAWKRNRHGVSLATVQRMADTIKVEKLPARWSNEIVMVEIP